MKEFRSKFLFSAILGLLGIVVLFIAITNKQNVYVVLGALGIIASATILAYYNHNKKIEPKVVSVIAFILVIISIAYATMDYLSIEKKLEFERVYAKRRAKVITSLENIRTAQTIYKGVKGEYAKSFDMLSNFFATDSLPIVKAIGNVPDSISEAEAVSLGIVSRDTILIAVKDTILKGINIDSLMYIPVASNSTKFEMDAGEIEKSKVKVKVFMAFASNASILEGLDLSNENIDLSEGLQVGSMTDATTDGNW